MMLDLIKLGLGASMGAVATFFLLRRWFRNYAEYEAWLSYQTGFTSGKSQGRFDARRAGLSWGEKRN